MNFSFKEFFQKYKHLLVLLYYIVLLNWYNYCERHLVPKYNTVSRIDKYIPFVKVFVVPYLFWFVYIIATIVYLGFKSRHDFLKVCLFMFTGMTICYTLYMVFPNWQSLRPAVHGNDIFSVLIRYIYRTDTPSDVNPSIHVLNAIGIHSAIVHYVNEVNGKKWVKNTSLICMILIICSTMLIKQHAVYDVLSAFALSGVLYFFIYYIPDEIKEREASQDYKGV